MSKYTLTRLDGVELGDVWRAQNRRYSLRWKGLPTASFDIRLDDSLAAEITDRSGDVLLKVYDHLDVLQFIGDLTTAEEVGQDDKASLACNFAGPLWRLQHRLCGKSTTGFTFSSSTQRAEVIWSLIDAANTESDTGIRRGTVGTTGGMTLTEPWRYKPISEGLMELCTIASGFDFTFAPVEPVADAGGIKIANFNAGTLGTSRPGVVFEYGERSLTVKSYRRVISRESLLNVAYSLDPNDPSGADVKGALDATSITARGAFEGVVAADVGDPALRQALVDQYVAVRKVPKQIVTFEPSSLGPVYGTDYYVGDEVTARARVNGTVRYDGLVRVYGIDVSLDEEGKETITPILVEE